jgi:hypothetical protein
MNYDREINMLTERFCKNPCKLLIKLNWVPEKIHKQGCEKKADIAAFLSFDCLQAVECLRNTDYPIVCNQTVTESHIMWYNKP